MPTITKIAQQKRSPNRVSVFLDNRFAFGCNLNIIARFKLHVGLSLTEAELKKIEQGELRQECLDQAVEYLQRRLHSRAELSRKLLRREYPEPLVIAILDDLQRMNYIDDKRFATAKALSAAQHKHHGIRRAGLELFKAGVPPETARRALDDVYESHDSMAVARALIKKKAAQLKKLDPATARRRVYGMLLRRGFTYDDIRPVVEEALGADAPTDDV